MLRLSNPYYLALYSLPAPLIFKDCFTYGYFILPFQMSVLSIILFVITFFSLWGHSKPLLLSFATPIFFLINIIMAGFIMYTDYRFVIILTIILIVFVVNFCLLNRKMNFSVFPIIQLLLPIIVARLGIITITNMPKNIQTLISALYMSVFLFLVIYNIITTRDFYYTILLPLICIGPNIIVILYQEDIIPNVGISLCVLSWYLCGLITIPRENYIIDEKEPLL